MIDRPAGSVTRYNKGEWAELYVLARVLRDGRLEVGKHGGSTRSRSLVVTHVKRAIRTTQGPTESFTVEESTIRCDHTQRLVARSEIAALVPQFLRQIKSGKGAFNSSCGDDLLALLDISRLKGSGEKSDVFIDVVDPLTGSTGLQGYTIKAFVGSPPTLLNASGATNVRFDIRPEVPDIELAHIAPLTVRKRIRHLVDSGYVLSQSEMNPKFRRNLAMLDSSMPELVGHLLLTYYSMTRGEDASVAALVKRVATTNPFGVPNPIDFYSHKVKDLLEAVAYGMVPARPWTGTSSAAGGLIMVEKSGDLVCIPQGGRDEHREYLFGATKLDTPETTKHGFGAVESDASGQYIKANLQIRYR